MTQVGVREMRQRATELVKRAEAGEQIVVTVAGRPAAVLGPVPRRAWRTWVEIADALRGPDDPDWETDLSLLDADPADPWSRM